MIKKRIINCLEQQINEYKNFIKICKKGTDDNFILMYETRIEALANLSMAFYNKKIISFKQKQKIYHMWLDYIKETANPNIRQVNQWNTQT